MRDKLMSEMSRVSWSERGGTRRAGMRILVRTSSVLLHRIGLGIGVRSTEEYGDFGLLAARTVLR